MITAKKTFNNYTQNLMRREQNSSLQKINKGNNKENQRQNGIRQRKHITKWQKLFITQIKYKWIKLSKQKAKIG